MSLSYSRQPTTPFMGGEIWNDMFARMAEREKYSKELELKKQQGEQEEQDYVKKLKNKLALKKIQGGTLTPDEERLLGSYISPFEMMFWQTLGGVKNEPSSTETSNQPPKGNGFGNLFSGLLGGNKNNFATEAEAEAAGLPPGTVVTINGRKARIRQ